MSVGQLADLPLQGDRPGSGAAFRLRKPVATPTRHDGAFRSVQVNGWTTTLSTDSGIVACYSDQQIPIDEIFGAALANANRGLDFMCALTYCDGVIRDPHGQSLSWSSAGRAVTMRITRVIPAASGFGPVAVRVYGSDGNERIETPPTPQLHDALRFVRMARTSHVLTDAYRNMFLAMESLLHHVYPQAPKGLSEGQWFKEALAHADPLVPVSVLAPQGETDPVGWVHKHIYGDFRSGMMHAKRSYHLPGDEARRVEIEQSFNTIWRYVSSLMQKILHIPPQGGRWTEAGWQLLCEATFKNSDIAATSDNGPIEPEGGSLSPSGGPLLRVAPGVVTYPEPGVGIADGMCSGGEAREVGPIRRIGTIVDGVHAGMWADLPGDLVVGDAVEKFQIRIGIRNALVDGVRAHFPM